MFRLLFLLLAVLPLNACFILKRAAYNSRQRYYAAGTSYIAPTEELDYTYDGHVLIKAAVRSDTSQFFIVDNGGLSELSGRSVSVHKLPALTYATAYDAYKNVVDFSVYKLDTLRIGNSMYRNYGFGGSSLSNYPRLSCQGLGGLVGVNIMEHAVWSFDHRRKKVMIASSIESIPEDKKKYRIPLRNRYGHHYIDICVNGKKLRAILDLGYNGGLLLPRKMLSEDDKTLIYYGLTGKTLSHNSYDTSRYHRCANVALAGGQVTLQDRFANFSSHGQALLGNRLLEEFYLTLDLAHNALYLAPYQDSETRSTFNTFGYSINTSDDKWLVTTLLEDGPAEVAGLRVNDEVLSINGVDLSASENCAVYEVIDTVMNSVGPVRLLVLRNGERTSISIPAKMQY